MNKSILLGLVAASLTVVAQAQTPSTSSVSATAPAAGQTTTSVQEVKAPVKSKWARSFVSVNAMDATTYSAQRGNTAVESENSLGLSYALTDKMAVEGQYNFALRTNPNTLDAKTNATYDGDTAITTRDPVIRLKGKAAAGLSADPLAWSVRYYIPVGFDALNKKTNGVIRGDLAQSWTLNPRWSTEVSLSARSYLNSQENPNRGVGSDSILRLASGFNLTYAANDSFGLYVAPATDLRSSRMLRGQFNADVYNLYLTEAGANIQVGPVTINPAVVEYKSLADGSYAGTEYDLNVIANF